LIYIWDNVGTLFQPRSYIALNDDCDELEGTEESHDERQDGRPPDGDSN